MALETLKDVKSIGGYKVIVMDELKKLHPEKFNDSGSMDYKWFEKEIRPVNFIYVRHDKNSISFTIQNGPIKEVGVNGCQVDTLIETAVLMLEGLDRQYPSGWNKMAITGLDLATEALKQRKLDREQRGVEGTSNV